MNHKFYQGIHFLHLKGNYIERVKAHSQLLRPQIQDGALVALAKKNEWLIRRAGGPFDWKPLQNAIVGLYHKVVIPLMEKSLRFKDKDLMHIIANESGLPYQTVLRAMFQADGLMLLSRISVMKYLFKDLPARQLPACSSAAVMGDWTSNGKMLVLRNQDYPVVGPWERNTTVAFHEPSDFGEIPHVSVTSAGLHTSGLTAMNREGLTLAAHAHFGKDVTLRGQPVFVVGTEIISKAKSISEAVDIAKRFKRNANWAFLISSAKDKSAVVLEMTPTKVCVRYPEEGFINHTNFFHIPEMKHNEALISAGRHEDDFARLCRMKKLLLQNKGSLTPTHMAKVLGDHHDPWSNEEKVLGNTVSVMSTIKSVVFSPEEQNLWVSTRGKSPMGLGRFLKIDASNFLNNFDENTEPEFIEGGSTETPGMMEFIDIYRNAYMAYHMESSTPDYMEKTLYHLRKACERNCPDANVWAQAGYIAFKMGKFLEAQKYFEATIPMNLTELNQSGRDLFLARCYDMKGERQRALELYAKWSHYFVPALKKAHNAGLKKPYLPKSAKHLMIDLQFVDPISY